MPHLSTCAIILQWMAENIFGGTIGVGISLVVLITGTSYHRERHMLLRPEKETLPHAFAASFLEKA